MSRLSVTPLWDPAKFRASEVKWKGNCKASLVLLAEEVLNCFSLRVKWARNESFVILET